jgi:hypothetical protein
MQGTYAETAQFSWQLSAGEEGSIMAPPTKGSVDIIDIRTF